MNEGEGCRGSSPHRRHGGRRSRRRFPPPSPLAAPKPTAPSSSSAPAPAVPPPIPMSPLRVAAVGAYVGSIFVVAASIIIAALLLPHPAAVAWLALLVGERERGE